MLGWRTQGCCRGLILLPNRYRLDARAGSVQIAQSLEPYYRNLTVMIDKGQRQKSKIIKGLFKYSGGYVFDTCLVIKQSFPAFPS